MPLRTTIPLLTGCLLVLGGCTASNPWWEASQSGWAQYGSNVDVPRKARPVPISLLAEASTWNQPIYIEGWIDEVDREAGSWMMVSDGTTSPVMVVSDGRFALPRNARGRRTMVWGHPLVASGSSESGTDTPRRSMKVEFMAESVKIQGFYGLETPPRTTFEAPPAAPPVPTIPAADAEPVDETASTTDPAPEQKPSSDAGSDAPPPIVDLPDR